MKDKEAWYSTYDLEHYFNIKGKLLARYIKEGFLKNRIISGEIKKIHLQLFLLKDNKGTLPPKSLLYSRTVKVTKDGKEYFTSEYWYEYVDIPRFKKLAKYRIIECLRETFAQPINTGRFYYKEINPLFSSSTSKELG